MWGLADGSRRKKTQLGSWAIMLNLMLLIIRPRYRRRHPGLLLFGPGRQCR